MSTDTRVDIENAVTVIFFSSVVGYFIGWLTNEWVGYTIAFIMGCHGTYVAVQKSKARRSQPNPPQEKQE